MIKSTQLTVLVDGILCLNTVVVISLFLEALVSHGHKNA